MRPLIQEVTDADRSMFGGERVTAVRVVDTATHPGCQGRGIFRTLTLEVLDEFRGTERTAASVVDRLYELAGRGG
jgi:hypothetical protein